MQQSFLPEIQSGNWLAEKKNRCPICKRNPKYHRQERIKKGYTVIDDFGRYRFAQTGWEIVNTGYWSCKECAKKMSPVDYNNFIIDNSQLFV